MNRVDGMFYVGWKYTDRVKREHNPSERPPTPSYQADTASNFAKSRDKNRLLGKRNPIWRNHQKLIWRNYMYESRCSIKYDHGPSQCRTQQSKRVHFECCFLLLKLAIAVEATYPCTALQVNSNATKVMAH
jgi:hypothetical protein